MHSVSIIMLVLILPLPLLGGSFVIEMPCTIENTYWFTMDPDEEEGILSKPGCVDQKALVLCEVDPAEYGLYMDPSFKLLRVKLFNSERRIVLMKRDDNHGYLITEPGHLCGLLGTINSPRKALEYLEFLESEMVCDSIFTGAIVVHDEVDVQQIMKRYDLVPTVVPLGEESWWDAFVYKVGGFFPTVRRHRDDFLVKRIILTAGKCPQLALTEICVSQTGEVSIVKLETLAL